MGQVIASQGSSCTGVRRLYAPRLRLALAVLRHPLLLRTLIFKLLYWPGAVLPILKLC